MLATGCRIGKGLAGRYDVNRDGRPLLNLDAGTWEVNVTVVRVTGKGLILQHRPKTAAGWRVVALPPSALRLLGDRSTRDEEPAVRGRPVFTAPLRVRCDQKPWSWVSPHTFRKTVAIRLDEAGLSPLEVADQLGHANSSMTLDVNFGRNVVIAAAAQVLDGSTPVDATTTAARFASGGRTYRCCSAIIDDGSA